MARGHRIIVEFKLDQEFVKGHIEGIHGGYSQVGISDRELRNRRAIGGVWCNFSRLIPVVRYGPPGLSSDWLAKWGRIRESGGHGAA